MKTLNTALLRLAKRAETYDRKHLIESFVDVGPLFALLSNPDSQVLFGRRGTGKTHVLGYLASQLLEDGRTAVSLDMRTVGSNGGIYADTEIPISERASRLVVDTLCAIHEQILELVVEHSDRYDLSQFGPALDRFITASTEVIVKGSVETEEVEKRSERQESQRGAALSATSSGISGEWNGQKSRALELKKDQTTRRSGQEQLRVHFGTVASELKKLLDLLPRKVLWVILDEWSEIPLDLQPYVADLLRRTILPIKGVTLKIAAIEQRCRFRIADDSVGHVGLEIGADIAASINLDEFLVFENNPDHSLRFFQELLFRHVRAITSEPPAAEIADNSERFMQDVFTQRPAFEEFVRAAEGVPRDAINIVGIAAQAAMEDAISVSNVRAAARTWYTRSKQQAVGTKEEAQELLNWIIDDVIKGRRAKAFLLESSAKDPLIDFLYDARVLHLIRAGVSGGDVPGRRFNVYALDYGCYVDLVTTTKAPQGLLPIDENGELSYTDVPQTDFRSIRRAILDLRVFHDRTRDAPAR